MLDWLRRASGLRGPHAEPARWVVVDVETTGLDPHRDRLLAVAAVAIERQGDALRVRPSDSFEAVLRHEIAPGAAPDRHNILLHGIGTGAQRNGAEPAAVLRAFADWADRDGTAPRLGFHVAFDRAVIERQWRAQRAALGAPPGAAWIDLEPLAALAHPEVKARALDEWLDHFGIGCLQRHNAAADALATAELLLRLWPRLRKECSGRVAELAKLAEASRWLRRQ